MSQYTEFLREYESFIEYLPGDVNLPQGFFQNYRGWDYYQVMTHGAFKTTDSVYEGGALHTFFCLYLAPFVRRLTVTDSGYWAAREHNQKLMTFQEWMRTVIDLGRPKIIGLTDDLTDIQFPDYAFEKVICISTIEHILDDRRALSEMMRVLGIGGKLLLTTEYNPTHTKAYSEADGSYYRVYDEAGIAALFDGYNITAREENEPLPNMPFHTLFIEVTK